MPFSIKNAARQLHTYTLLLSVACTLGLSFSSQVNAAENRNLAAGFSTIPRGAKVVVMPTDVEVFEINAGGVTEPKAEWTEAAAKNIKEALRLKKQDLDLGNAELPPSEAENLAEINALHATVAYTIAVNHLSYEAYRLPTKGGKLDWSLGEAAMAIKMKTKADFALFTWMRDSYSTSERKEAAEIAAARGKYTPGIQMGYASLVDLNTGRIVWFNKIYRAAGDLRNLEAAKKSVAVLLTHFPEVK